MAKKRTGTLLINVTAKRRCWRWGRCKGRCCHGGCRAADGEGFGAATARVSEGFTASVKEGVVARAAAVVFTARTARASRHRRRGLLGTGGGGRASRGGGLRVAQRWSRRWSRSTGLAVVAMVAAGLAVVAAGLTVVAGVTAVVAWHRRRKTQWR